MEEAALLTLDPCGDNPACCKEVQHIVTKQIQTGIASGHLRNYDLHSCLIFAEGLGLLNRLNRACIRGS